MLYFPFHVGDWITGTKLMSAVEKGVYIDLLTFYYSVERPITEDECKRIARAYANAEQDAMQYVLQNHFAYENGVYRHKKCDVVITQTLEKQSDISEKRRNAAQSRWNRAKKQKEGNANGASENARAYANAEQEQSKCNTDEMLTNNHKPITKNINNTNKQQTEICNEEPAREDDVCSENFDDPLIEQAENLAAEQTQKVVDDPDAVVTPVQVIGLARFHGIKVARTIKLEQVCKQQILTVDNVRQCIRIAKKEQKGGPYLVGILANAVNEPNEYHTWEYQEQKRKEWQEGVDENVPF